MTRIGLALATGAALVLLVAVVGSLVTDESQPEAFPGLTGNSLIAYSYEGDIYIGDPVTGETAPIVTNPQYEVNPVFSPDGERIAFVRGDPQSGDATIVVVRADGSDERVVLPKGREHRGFAVLAWTPDGASLVVQLDTPPFTYPYGDGELSLFDSFGTGEERLLAPPLRLSIGGHYFNSSSHVAPMFRPPAGDQVVSADANELSVLESDLTTATPVGREALRRYEPFFPGRPIWSPDGTRIAFNLGLIPTVRDGHGLFVVSAEGDELRRVGEPLGENVDYRDSLWSPDGSRIAVERVRSNADRAVLVILDVDSGQELSLESTSAAGKDAGARFSTLTYNNVVHHWYYEGWMWAPDGRSLLVLEDHRTHPWVVDIATDTVTELPWLADSMPSWQPVPSG